MGRGPNSAGQGRVVGVWGSGQWRGGGVSVALPVSQMAAQFVDVRPYRRSGGPGHCHIVTRRGAKRAPMY
jgi:hypothetical protein